MPPGQRLRNHTVDVGVCGAEFGRALGDHATPALGVGRHVGDYRPNVPGQTAYVGVRCGDQQEIHAVAASLRELSAGLVVRGRLLL